MSVRVGVYEIIIEDTLMFLVAHQVHVLNRFECDQRQPWQQQHEIHVCVLIVSRCRVYACMHLIM